MPINSFLYPGAKTTLAYEVANSCRFNQPDNPYLTRAISSAGSTTTVSISFWFKRGKLADDLHVFSAKDTGVHASSIDEIKITSGDILRVENYNGSGYNYRKLTTRVFRDPSSWYHILVVYDTSNSTAGDRIQIYINGVRETSFSTSTDPSENAGLYWFDATDPFIIGTDARTLTGASNLDGYLSEVVVLDGTAASVTDFGEFDSDSPNIWKPINVSGLTFGTNGFYLDFEDSSALGNDAAGSNNFTVNNLTATDQSTDTCTNNFATFNPLDKAQSSATYLEGNLKWTTTSGYFWNRSTIGVSSGKWYFEAKLTSAPEHAHVGIVDEAPDDNSDSIEGGTYNWGYKNSSGEIYNNGSGSSYGSTYTTGDIISVYLDLDNNKLYFAKNGSIQNSGTGISITASGSTDTGNYFFAVGDNASGTNGTWEANFGSPAFSISSGNSDPNGYGNFEYSPNDGGSASFDSSAKSFYALNTKNLAEFG